MSQESRCAWIGTFHHCCDWLSHSFWKSSELFEGSNVFLLQLFLPLLSFNNCLIQCHLLWLSTFIEKKVLRFFTLLQKLLAKPSCLHSSTMAYADKRSNTPMLPNMPSPDRNDSEWSWLIVPRSRVGDAEAALVRQRPPWLKSVHGACVVSVLCALLRGCNCHLCRK